VSAAAEKVTAWRAGAPHKKTKNQIAPSHDTTLWDLARGAHFAYDAVADNLHDQSCSVLTTAGDSCGAGGPGRAGWEVNQGKNYTLTNFTQRSHLR
jgi:hypothetical protein